MTAITPRQITFSEQLQLTARASRALLDELLAAEGTTFVTWLILYRLATDSARAVNEFRDDLATSLRLEPETVSGLLDQHRASGLIEVEDGMARQSGAGAALYHRLQDQIEDRRSRTMRGIDADDLATTMRVLTRVQRQAEEFGI